MILTNVQKRALGEFIAKQTNAFMDKVLDEDRTVDMVEDLLDLQGALCQYFGVSEDETQEILAAIWHDVN